MWVVMVITGVMVGRGCRAGRGGGDRAVAAERQALLKRRAGQTRPVAGRDQVGVPVGRGGERVGGDVREPALAEQHAGAGGRHDTSVRMPSLTWVSVQSSADAGVWLVNTAPPSALGARHADADTHTIVDTRALAAVIRCGTLHVGLAAAGLVELTSCVPSLIRHSDAEGHVIPSGKPSCSPATVTGALHCASAGAVEVTAVRRA